jgi:acetate kinase
LGGLDALVFTGGIGENDKLLRAEVAARCAWLGVAIDPALNDAGKGRISPDGAGVSVWVVTTNEELMIARHTTSLLGLGSASSTAPKPSPVTA